MHPSQTSTHHQTAPSQPCKQHPVVILGAGASGLFCAQLLGKAGVPVVVLDHANKAGKKILMSGGGRCNFINLFVDKDNFVGQNPHFVHSALSRFGVDDFLAYVYRHGIDFYEKSHGQLFCTHSSKDLLAMLLAECQDGKVQIWLNTRIDDICEVDTGFCLSLERAGCPSKLLACRVVVATGGLSIPTMGATGFGYAIAKQFGHCLVPTRASLVPLVFSDHFKEVCASLAGLAHEVVAYNAKKSFYLPMLFTHRGLSGPAILQLSNYWQEGEAIFLDMMPQHDAAEVLLVAKAKTPKLSVSSVLSPYFAKRLLLVLEAQLWSEIKDKPIGELKDKQLKALGQKLKAWQLKPAGSEGYRVAEVTMGGVDTQGVCSKSFESKHKKGLYFIGEVLDITGELGGYNFHWAWASAYCCAEAIKKSQNAWGEG